jgi:uncharacterized protein (TIGR03437 family)
MTYTTRKILLFCPLVAIFFGSTAKAQRADRLSTRIDSHQRVVLRGTRSSRIENLQSEGPVEDTMRVTGLSFRFRPTAQQSAELEQLLEDQQDPRSPLYHSWLTPEQFGERFGLSRKDMAAVRDWIVSEGFQIDQEARSRTYISFSGTAAQVRTTFGTELHHFRFAGKIRYANVRDAEIPAQLEPIVFPLKGLDDFPMQSHPRMRPQLNSSKGNHGLGPADLATIYNVNPLYAKGINGTGQKIAVIGQTRFDMSDVQAYRTTFGLPQNDPKMILVPGMADPGINDDLSEALLDVEVAGGIAPNATILYVYGPHVEQAVVYAIDQNLAPVISESYSGCENPGGGNGSAERNLAQQAAAQGITWIACTGDTGPAGCENQNQDYYGVSGVRINGPADIPEVTAVGGTTLAEGNGNYWSATEKDGRLSALSYIPETAWNDTTDGSKLKASGGGTSAFFPRPSWQTGPGVPNDNARHTPDVAFAASWDHDPYVIAYKDGLVTAGGTSAATPLFAGTIALLNQYVVGSGIQAGPGLGNINPRLYQLAQSGRGVFHDVTTGNNIIPCKTGTPDCYTGRYGYEAGAGYDMVTGLGSIDIGKLAENWAPSQSNPQSTVVPSVSPSPVYQQAPDSDGYGWYYEVQLEETGGIANTITSFSIDGYDLSDSIADWFGSATLPAYSTLSASLRSKDLKVPVDRVFAFGGVDANGQPWTRQISVSFLGAQKSAAISLTSTPSTVVLLGSSDPNCTPDHPFYQQLNLQELNGFDVTLTQFYALGNDYSGNIASWFGSLRLPALGSLHARLCWTLNTVPTTVSYEIHGVDKSGNDITSQLQVQFTSLNQKSGGLRAPAEITLSAQGSQSASATIPVDVPSDGRWSVSVFPANQRSSWLIISPQSGKGPGTIKVIASAAELPAGTYNATVVIESPDTVPQFVNVPVTFNVGMSASTGITGMQNAASYETAFAPGMLAAVYGNHLANSTQLASGSIPLTLAGVSATVNGIAAPLWFVSPGLINLQLPYETPVGIATLVVNNNGQVNSFEFPVRATAPGIFGQLAPAARGTTTALYLTGEGELNPLLETGATPDPSTTVDKLPRPRAPLSVTVGGRAAEVVFAGNPWLVGVLQVNFTIPADVPLGPQPVVVTVGDKSSLPAMLTVR